MAVANKELISGFPPDWQNYLDTMSAEDRQKSIENLTRIERNEKRKHNRMRNLIMKVCGKDLGPYKSLYEWIWEDYRKEKAQAIQAQEYAWLGLAPSDMLTKREVRNAYHRQARRLHPDVGGDAEAFKNLYAAYRAVLKTAVDK